MKTLYTTLTILAIVAQTSYSQNNTNTIETQYGFEFSQFTSSSGFKPGAEAHFTVRPTLKSQVGFGLYFDSNNQKLTGITITHKRMLCNYSIHQKPIFEPLFFYNFIYRKSNLPELKSDGTLGASASYTSMEHHIGLGCNINIFSKFSIQTEAGYGLYLGSIKKPSSPDPITNEISGTNGWGSIFKIGIGYHL